MSARDIDQLICQALIAQELGMSDPATRNPAFEWIAEHPTRETFETAVRLSNSSLRNEKELGVRILSELGRSSRPYAHESFGVLRRLVCEHPDEGLLVWITSALGNQHVSDALPTLWALAEHPSPLVRDAVCGAISGAVVHAGLDHRSIDVLVILSQDLDPQVRFSATFELASWSAYGVNDLRVATALDRARHDPDPKVMSAATYGNEA